MAKLEVGYHYEFGELKSGDRFAWNGLEYEKLSGNLADLLLGGKLSDPIKTVEVPPDTKVYLFELG
jgi:hypothetical protein